MGKLDNFREILKNTKHRKVTQIFCPRCCSPKIALNNSLDLWLTPRQYHCEACGYTGILVMELEEDKESAAQSSAALQTDPETEMSTEKQEN
jgi:ribosomal protein S27AE